MQLKQYSELPDFMPSSEIESYINEILDITNSNAEVSKLDLAGSLLEMLERQNNNYNDSLSSQTSDRIRQWIMTYWSLSSIDFVDIVSTIIVNFGNQCSFPEGRELLETALKSSDPDIQNIAKDALGEMP